MRLDAVDKQTKQLEGTGVEDVKFTENEKEVNDDEKTGPGGNVQPMNAEISSSFGVLERAAEEGGNDNATFYLQKARMAFVKAHASKPVWQADKTNFF